MVLYLENNQSKKVDSLKEAKSFTLQNGVCKDMLLDYEVGYPFVLWLIWMDYSEKIAIPSDFNCKIRCEYSEYNIIIEDIVNKYLHFRILPI